MSDDRFLGVGRWLIPWLLALALGLGGGGGEAAAKTPNDSLWSSQWGLQAMGAAAAWDLNWGGSSSVKVAVLDSGVAWGLSDFTTSHFDRTNAWDFYDNDADPSNDASGHGSHVAGSIAQATNNAQGTAGLAFNSTLLPIRVAGTDNQFVSNAKLAQAIDYAVAKGADIINLSFGQAPTKKGDTYTYSASPELEAACQRAHDAGVLVVAAAGNAGYAALDLPAMYSSVLAVGAVDRGLGLASYSSHSSNMVVAPGSDILQQSLDGSYQSRSGTSMAAALVSASAALVLSEGLEKGSAPGKGSARTDWLSGLLKATTQDLGATGMDGTYGYGLVRVDQALARLQ